MGGVKGRRQKKAYTVCYTSQVGVSCIGLGLRRHTDDIV